MHSPRRTRASVGRRPNGAEKLADGLDPGRRRVVRREAGFPVADVVPLAELPADLLQQGDAAESHGFVKTDARLVWHRDPTEHGAVALLAKCVQQVPIIKLSGVVLCAMENYCMTSTSS